MRKLTTTNLELAVWIARLGSFTAAAERMHTTQPAVSARVKELEDTLRQRLFVRQGRGVELTPEGREFVTRAEALLRDLDALSGAFSSANLAGVVRLGTSSICLDLLAALSVQMRRAMPLVSFEVDLDRAAPLLYRLETRRIDLAIVSGPIDAHKFRARSLGYDRMFWVTSPAVRAARQDQPAATRCVGLPIWCVHADSFYWSTATAALRDLGADLGRVNAVASNLAVARVVAAGAGIGLVSEHLVRNELARGTLVPVPDLEPCETIEFSVVTMADTGSRVIDEVVAATVANSPFARVPPVGPVG